jgi:hypothetical protein
VKKCVVLQVNDAAVRIRLYSCTGVKKYTDYRTDWRGKGREEKGATPLTCYVG